jgi:tetratricopeptide (TPR) repeat protein
VNPAFNLGDIVKSNDNNSTGVVVGWDMISGNDDLLIRVVHDESVTSQIVRVPSDRLNFVSSCDDPSIVSHRSLHLYVADFQDGRFVPSNELAYVFDLQDETDGLLEFQHRLNDVVDVNLHNSSCGSRRDEILGSLQNLLQASRCKRHHTIVDSFVEYVRCQPPVSFGKKREQRRIISDKMHEGTSNMLLGENVAALEIYDNIVKENKKLMDDFVEVFHKRAVANYLLGHYDTSKNDLNLVIEKDPAHYNAWMRKGYIDLIQENPTDALYSFERVLELSPWYPGVMTNITCAKNMISDDMDC